MLEDVSLEQDHYVAIMLLNDDAAFEYVVHQDLCIGHPIKAAFDYYHKQENIND